MRSFFLEGLTDERLATSGLSEAFPDQEAHRTKSVSNSLGNDAIAWLYVASPDDPDDQEGPFLIQADVSGRYTQIEVDPLVIEALRRIQRKTGGVIRDDNGNLV